MRRSIRSYTLLGASILLIILLISTISQQTFHDGNPMPADLYSQLDQMGGVMERLFSIFEQQIGSLQDRVGEFQNNLSLFAVPLSIATLVLMALLFLLSRNARRAILVRTIAGFAVMGLLVYIFYSGVPDSEADYGEMIITDMGEDMGRDVLPEESEEVIAEPAIPKGVSYLFSFILILLILMVITLAIWRVMKIRARKKGKSLLDVTVEALSSIKKGSDYKNVILRCYDEMTLFVKDQAGIVRSASMTPAEFTDRLADEGLPPENIRVLTQLFQQVRYGQGNLSKSEEEKAESCLKSIVSALGDR